MVLIAARERALSRSLPLCGKLAVLQASVSADLPFVSVALPDARFGSAEVAARRRYIAQTLMFLR